MPMSESSPTERIHLCGHFSHPSEAPPSEDTKHQVMLSLRIVAACDDATPWRHVRFSRVKLSERSVISLAFHSYGVHQGSGLYPIHVGNRRERTSGQAKDFVTKSDHDVSHRPDRPRHQPERPGAGLNGLPLKSTIQEPKTA